MLRKAFRPPKDTDLGVLKLKRSSLCKIQFWGSARGADPRQIQRKRYGMQFALATARQSLKFDLNGFDFSGLEFSGIQLSGIDLSELDRSRLEFSRFDFGGCDFWDSIPAESNSADSS